jgi:hypothetical protein
MKKLAVLVAALMGAFVVAPAWLATNASTADLHSERRLIAAFRSAFVTYWQAGDGVRDPGLQRVVDYWFRYHIAKGVIATALLVALVPLGVLLWRAFLRTGGFRAALFAAGGVLTTGLAVLSLVTVMANGQGAAAPFGSLLPVLIGTSDAPLAGAVAQVNQQLPDWSRRPALGPIMDEYVRYHAVVAIEGAIAVVALIAVSVLLWRRLFTRTSRTDRRARRLLASYGVFTPLLSLALAVVVVGNVTTTAHPLPGLEGLFAGGW